MREALRVKTLVSEEDVAHSSMQLPWTSSTTSITNIRSDVDPQSPVVVCISRRMHSSSILHNCPIMTSANEPFTFFQDGATLGNDNGDLGPYQYPPRIEQATWYHELWDLLCDQGTVEMEEEGPIIYVASHCISHEYHLANMQSRPLRHETWEAGIRFVWEDLFDNHAVSPDPPIPSTQGAVATVLITQHPLPDRAACVITVQDEGRPPTRTWQTWTNQLLCL